MVEFVNDSSRAKVPSGRIRWQRQDAEAASTTTNEDEPATTSAVELERRRQEHTLKAEASALYARSMTEKIPGLVVWHDFEGTSLVCP